MSFALRSSSFVVGIALLGCGEIHGQAATGSFRETLAVDAPLELDVSTGSGSITIRGGARGEVAVLGTIRVSRSFARSRAEAEDLVRRIEADPPIELSGATLRVGYVEDPELRRNVSISYEIEVPAETEVRSRTGSGSQVVAGVAGPVGVNTGSGSVTLTDIGGAAEATTGSGSIRAERVAGAFNGRTGSGSVRLVQTADADVDVSTGSGSVDLQGVSGTAHVRTGSGSISLEGEQRGRWDLETGSGSVRVRLPADAAFALDARTSSGEVFSGHPITMQGRITRGALRGDVRGGGDALYVRTGSGDIRIE